MLQIFRCIFLLVSLVSFGVAACEMKMGYRTTERLPLITKAPKNEGLYVELYRKALNQIGCKLAVVRAPKKRIMYMLEIGEIDFYPGLGYSPGREKFLHYIDSGMNNRSVVVSHIDSKDVFQLSDMEGKTLLTSQGSKPIDTSKFDITRRAVYDLSIAKAVELIANKQADYYLYGSNSIRYYLKNNPNDKVKVNNFDDIVEPIYLGFSKHSQFAKSEPNIVYDPKQEKSVFNVTSLIANNTKAYEFQAALAEMKKNGYTKSLVDKFISN